VILGLLVAVTVLATLASRIEVPYPILLVLGGLVLGFLPGLPRVELPPDLVFLIFLPPLLYVAALLTSWRDFRANLRPISLLAIGLVIFTICAVTAVAHAAIEGLTWPAAFALGAIVSPTDAIAATTVALLRFLWVFPATYLPRVLSRRLRERDPSPPGRRSWLYRGPGCAASSRSPQPSPCH
jgi:CPA1 family monovalent cation:H+ antiporter